MCGNIGLKRDNDVEEVAIHSKVNYHERWHDNVEWAMENNVKVLKGIGLM